MLTWEWPDVRWGRSGLRRPVEATRQAPDQGWGGGEGIRCLWLPPCEVCTGRSCKELRGVEDRGRRMRNARSAAVDGRVGGHDPPRFWVGLPGRYEHRLLPICCPTGADPALAATIRIGCM